MIGFTEDCELVSWNEEEQSESFSCANGCTRTVYLDSDNDFWRCPSTVEGYLVAHYDGGLVWAGRRCRQDSECGTSGNYICNTSEVSGIDFAYSCRIAAQCVSGYYRSTHKDDSSREICVPCPDGYFCTQNQKQECPDGYTAMAGAGAISDCCKSCTRACTQQSCPSNATCTHGSTSTTGTICYGGSCNAAASTCSITATCNAGYYLSNGACVKCEAGYYCPGNNNRSACSGRTQYSAAGATGCLTVSSGYYSTGCNASGNNCTGQSQCTGNDKYCSGGIEYTCPDPMTYKRTTFPSHYYNPTISNARFEYTANGKTSASQCLASFWMDSTLGKLYEYAMYNTSTQKYDNTHSYGFYTVVAGYYLTDKSSCGLYTYYRTVKQCPTGSYCPGNGIVSCNTSNQATVHTTNFGLNSCPGGYPNSAAGATAITSCYSNTKSRAWTGSQTACKKPTNSTTYSCTICSVAACDYVAYSNNTGSGDGDVKSGCNSNNATCQQSVTPGSIVCNAGYYISGTTCPACTNKPSNSSYTGTATSNSCPWACNSGYNLTDDNQCGQFCTSGITHIHTSTGLKIPLYATARTTPAINVKWNDTICYGSLATGAGSGMNVKYNGTTYHAVE
ncbi:MAG: hypothetical protein E7011_00015 [Alphaproteobacteria bacterium]|nr:hypothetical protein [Alphaproteobacteria bacterium]